MTTFLSTFLRDTKLSMGIDYRFGQWSMSSRSYAPRGSACLSCPEIWVPTQSVGTRCLLAETVIKAGKRINGRRLNMRALFFLR